MSARPHSPHAEPKFTGLFHDHVPTDSLWLREEGTLTLPPLVGVQRLVLIGKVLPPDADNSTSLGSLGLRLTVDGHVAAETTTLPVGPFQLTVEGPAHDLSRGSRLALQLLGVERGNLLAWLGRITRLWFLQPWRRQALNRRLRIQRIEVDGELLFDFSNLQVPWNFNIPLRYRKVGLNLVGYYRAVLGVGESVRCATRAAEAAGLPVACIELKLPCQTLQTDDTFATRLQTENPHPVNVIHVDAPGMRDIDHHHGAAFRRGKYNIGYWAWELPEFPDAWVHFADYCDEIWTPSRFVTEAIAEKLPVPVLTMPHAISFARPEGDFRGKFGLPRDKYLFLFLYDLNSYSARKNPAAVLEAFRASGLAGRGAALVIKVHNGATNAADLARLEAAAASLPDTTLINQALSRQEIYELESACDCFVSLHRSEGFGLALAEAMYLGKPVIATDWSASTEFLRSDNGCPVRYQLVKLDRNHGPYAKGQTWAEPDVAHAAEWMQRLFADRALGERLGMAARATIERQFSPAAIGARYRRRLEAIAGW